MQNDIPVQKKAILHLKAGAKKVLVTAPAKGNIRNIVFGVNDNSLIDSDNIISAASCTTNAIVPVLKVISDQYGIQNGHIETVHSYTNDQNLIDNYHTGDRRGRSAPLNMVITSTGAAKAVGLVLPELDGKLDGVAIRVPTPNVSAIDLTFEAGQHTNKAEITDMMQAAAAGPLKGVLDVTDEPLVSSDFNHDPHSSVFHIDQTLIIDGDMGRIFSLVRQ